MHTNHSLVLKIFFSLKSNLSVLTEHAGQYSIRAENIAGRATSTATLNVLLGIGSPAAPSGQFQFPSSMKHQNRQQQVPVYALIKSEGSESRRASDGDIIDPGE